MPHNASHVSLLAEQGAVLHAEASWQVLLVLLHHHSVVLPHTASHVSLLAVHGVVLQAGASWQLSLVLLHHHLEGGGGAPLQKRVFSSTFSTSVPGLSW